MSRKEVPIKFLFNEEIRRVAKSNTPRSYEDLVKCAKETFSFGTDSIVFLQYYDDEGDLILVTSDLEIEEALRIVEEENRPSLKLLVKVSSANENKSTTSEGVEENKISEDDDSCSFTIVDTEDCISTSDALMESVFNETSTETPVDTPSDMRSVVSESVDIKAPDVVEDGVVEDNVVEDGVVEDNVVEDNVVEDGVVEDGVVEDNVVEDNVVEDGVVEDGVVEDNIVEDKSTENVSISRSGSTICVDIPITFNKASETEHVKPTAPGVNQSLLDEILSNFSPFIAPDSSNVAGRSPFDTAVDPPAPVSSTTVKAPVAPIGRSTSSTSTTSSSGTISVNAIMNFLKLDEVKALIPQFMQVPKIKELVANVIRSTASGLSMTDVITSIVTDTETIVALISDVLTNVPDAITLIPLLYSREKEANEPDVADYDLIHEGVICDGCDKKNFIGKRYKCFICADYDLCASCYEKNVHHDDHPFIEIRNNDQIEAMKTYRGHATLMRPFRNDFFGGPRPRGPRSHGFFGKPRHHGRHGPRHHGRHGPPHHGPPHHGPRGPPHHHHGPPHHHRGPPHHHRGPPHHHGGPPHHGPPHHGPQKPNPALDIKMDKSSRNKIARVLNHKLDKMDKKMDKLEKKEKHLLLKKQNVTHSRQERKIEKKLEKIDCKRKHILSKYDKATRGMQAKFVKDVNVPDGNTMKPGQKFCKSWTMKNVGDVAWDEDTKLVPVGGVRMSGPAFVSVGKVLPGAEAEISCDLVAPNAQGRYVGYWRLVNNAGVRFGHRIWVDIFVMVTPSSSPEDNSPIAAAVDSSSIPIAIAVEAKSKDLPVAKLVDDEEISDPVVKTLVGMGFENNERLRELIKRHSGNIGNVVNDLLS